MATKTAKRTDPKSVKPTSDAPKATDKPAPAEQTIVQIPQSLWIKICKYGLKQRFYETDAISRLFMGDNIDDILRAFPPEQPVIAPAN